MNAKRRDRVVVFRVTGNEYDILVNASARGGARSLSDFARQELFSRLKPTSETAGAPIQELLSQLRSAVAALVAEIEDMRKKWTLAQ